MNSRKLVYIITLALILFNLFYRISPALTNAPVFSLDAWSLLTDVKYMLENGKGSLVSCNSLPSCYFGYWPSPIVITTITSQITNLNIYWAPVVVTFFMNTLFIFALLLIIYRIILNKLRAFFFGSLIISSLWFTNIFYSGFKAEMIAMPLLMVLILLLIRFEEGNSRETKLIPLILYIFLIIVFTHHFTTYIAMASIGGYFVYKHVKNKLASFDKILFSIFSFSFLILVIYYSFQGFSTLESFASEGFFPTLISYYLILLMITGYTLLKGFKKFYLYVTILGIALAFVLSLGMSYFLPGMPSFSIYAASLAPPLILVLIYGIFGAYFMNKDYDSRLPIITSWSIAPFSLVIFSFFDGSGLTLNRGIIAASIPMTVLSAYFIQRIFNVQKNLSLIKFVNAIIIAVVLINGIFIQFQPYFQQRNVYTGISWYYSMDQIDQIKTIVHFIPQNSYVQSDSMFAQLASFFNSTFTISNSSLLLINKLDFNNSKYYSFGIGLGYSWTKKFINLKIKNSDVLFNSEDNILIMKK